jgi:hypothetical protein
MDLLVQWLNAGRLPVGTNEIAAKSDVICASLSRNIENAQFIYVIAMEDLAFDYQLSFDSHLLAFRSTICFR